MRRGILGGTFDPIHTGHLILAQEVLGQLGLDEIWFVPTGEPWMKRGQRLTSQVHRKEMVELAIKGNERFKLSTLEMDRPGKTYTVDTLEELRAGEMRDDEVLFIMGVDTLNSVHLWKSPERVLELAQLVVALRPGHGALDVGSLAAIDPTIGERLMTVRLPLIEISGTELRRRAASGESYRYLVPDAVGEYIKTNGLYRLG
jgi:nicotinate-nucleotide adenylyltransferase